MLTSTRTCYGLSAQTSNTTDLVHEIPTYATLNTAMSDPLIVPFQPNVPTLGMEVVDPYNSGADTSKLKLKYLCIGNKGHRVRVGSNSIPYTEEVPHLATDSGLRGMIPFAVKPVSNDLTISERARYRLRKTMLIEGVLYAAYYCRVLELAATAAETTLTTVTDTGEVTQIFNPTVNNLRPAMPDIGAENDGSYVNVSVLTSVTFTADDILLLKEACLRVFGDENLAIISELAFCSGVTKYTTSRYPNSGTQTPVALPADTFPEVVGIEVAYHTSCYYPANQFNEGLELTVDLGSTEPLFGASQA